MDKLKVVTVVGTRPEIIRLSRVISRFNSFFDHTLVHTGQNYDYELNEIFFNELDIKAPNHYLNAAGSNPAETIGNIIIAFDKVLELVNPDAVVVLGDTNSCLSIISAKRRKIPIFHLEAGNRCFDVRVPEEINRKIVDHTADINLTYSSIARQYLLAEGFPADRVIKVGSPMFEVISYYQPQIRGSNILDLLNLESEKYFVISAHREENINSDVNFFKLCELITGLAETYKLPIVFSVHPRTKRRMEDLNIQFPQLVKISKPLGFFDYIALQCNAKAVLSDSGTISEESLILNFPALNLREMHERPEATEERPIMMVGLDKNRVLQGLNILDGAREVDRIRPSIPKDYLCENVSDKVLRIVCGYTDYVNKTVWKKY